MTPFVLLVDEHLERSHARMLKAILSSAGLQPSFQTHDWATVRLSGVHHVLSAGKYALDQWHQWGLIQVGAQRGNIFQHRDSTYDIMVVEHPGTLMQQSVIGHGAKANMRADLHQFARLLDGYTTNALQTRMGRCGRCQGTRVKGGGGRVRPAEYWVDELDGVGLCSEHWRTRSRIKSKWKVARVDKGKPAAQIRGQLEMLPGDGTRLMVPKS